MNNSLINWIFKTCEKVLQVVIIMIAASSKVQYDCLHSSNWLVGRRLCFNYYDVFLMFIVYLWIK